MRKLWIWGGALFLTLMVPCGLLAETADSPSLKCFHRSIASDFKHYYSFGNLGKMGWGLLAAGVLANTDADENIQDWVQDDVVNSDTDDFSRAVKEMGSWTTMTPLYLGLAALRWLPRQGPLTAGLSTWGERTFRGLLVGMPSVLFWQVASGASRPSDGGDSAWHPFEDNNGTSGHTYTGAVPFLTAARMTENLYIKSLCYLGSTFTAFSRINDNQHYTSQAVLGWWLAYLAVECIEKTELSSMQVMPMPLDDGVALMVIYKF